MIVVTEGQSVWFRGFRNREEFEALIESNSKGPCNFTYTPLHVVDSKRQYVEVELNGSPFCRLWEVRLELRGTDAGN